MPSLADPVGTGRERTMASPFEGFATRNCGRPHAHSHDDLGAIRKQVKGIDFKSCPACGVGIEDLACCAG